MVIQVKTKSVIFNNGRITRPFVIDFKPNATIPFAQVDFELFLPLQMDKLRVHNFLAPDNNTNRIFKHWQPLQNDSKTFLSNN